jgi:hypothetical protein
MRPMPNPSTAAAARSPDTWAEVRAHDHVMRYRRSGTGRAVLVLCSADGAEELWPELADALAARFRLIVPDLPPGVDVAGWLGEFLEGLGSAGVAVVAADPFCVPALELALLDADQVARIVLVPGGEVGETGLAGALATTTRAASVSLLVVRRGLSAGDALPLVTRFLEGDG